MKHDILWLTSLLRLFYPHYCAVCGARLQDNEEALCSECLSDLPRTPYLLSNGHLVERLFWGKFPLGRAAAFFYYRPGDSYAEVIHLLKYKGRSDLGCAMGRIMAKELTVQGFFEGVDVLIPVPLHEKRLKQRGYNQSERIAAGISEQTGIPVWPAAVRRVKYTETQTQKTAQERFENMKDVFKLNMSAAELQDKHVMLIDDVLTTSATLTACADSMKDIKGITISILTLALAGH